MKKVLTFLFLIILISNINSQSIEYIDSLKKVHKNKNVIVLKDYDKIKIDIKGEELVIIRTVSQRLLYTNNKAQAYSEDDISFSSLEEVIKMEAFTEIRNKSKYKKIKTKNFVENQYLDDEVFYQDTKTYNFVYPLLSENAISNFTYSYKIKEPRLLSGNYFQNVFPIENIEFIIDVDENIDMGFVKFNFDSLKYEEDISTSKGRKIFTFKAKQVEYLDRGYLPPPIRYVIPHVIPYIKSYKTSTQTVNLLRNTDDLYEWYKSLLKKIPCKNIEEYSNKAKEIVSKYQSETDKVKAIFKWVQKNIKYIAVEVGMGGFVPESSSIVYKNKYGDCKGMANILYNMLKSVNITSHLTWVGSNDLPYKYSQIPSPVVDNHMILTYIDKNGKYYFLDATSENVIFGFPSEFIQGKQAMIEMGNSYEIKEVPIIPVEMNVLNDSIIMKIVGNTINAKGNVNFSGYYYTKVINKTSNILEDNKKAKFLNNFFERGNNKFIIKNTTETVNEDESIVNFKYNFTIGNYITKSKDEIFVNMNIFKGMLTKKIKEDRKYPMMFAMKNSYKYYLVLEIPDGYKIEHIPPNAKFENDLYKYSIKYTKKGNNKLIYELYSHYNTLFLKVDDFNKFNNFHDDVYKNFREVVILKKINK